jgi:membrane carboxypeptidase/penicillin-binding protein
MMTEEELKKTYQNEHVGNPHVEHELSFVNWKRQYLKFQRIEQQLDKMKFNDGYDSVYQTLDRESQRLAGILGY